MKPLITYTFDKEGIDFGPSFLSKVARKRAYKRAQWIDSVVAAAIPSWKIPILQRFPHRLVQKLLMVNIEIRHQHMLFDFGTQITIFLNKKLIGSRKFKT